MDTPNSVADLLEQQRQLEAEAALEGKRRLDAILNRARKRGTESQTRVGSALVNKLLVPVAELLTADISKRLGGGSSKGGVSLKFLYGLDPLRLGAVAIRAAIDFKSSDKRKLTETAGYIGRAIEDEYLWHCWEKANAKEARLIRKAVNERTNARVRHKSRGGYARRLQPDKVAAKAWGDHRQLQIGLRFVDYLVRCGLFRTTTVFANRGRGLKGKPALALKLTDEAHEWAEELADLIVAVRPLTWPLIVAPVPWTSPEGGGFHFREKLDHPGIPVPLKPLYIVNRRLSPDHRKVIAAADLSTIYAGLNAAQGTAWRINRRIYDVLTTCIDTGCGPDDVALPDPKGRPPRLPDDVWADMTVAEQRNHKREIAEVEEQNRKALRQRIEQHRLRKTVRRFVDRPEIYFAHQLDWRGRVYPVSPDISPHGNDKQRALLEFAHGDPLTESGVFWLKVHVANTYGFDKVSFEDRARWTEDNEDLILSVAAHPLDDTRWHAVSKKTRWQFLAACFAYADYSRDGIGSPCRVPVMLDGTCSGLQHWAALLRDESVGQHVNLVPGLEKPGDLYARAAERANVALREAAVRGEPWAAEWLAFKIDRSVTKPVVMGFPYGKSFSSILDDVRDAVNALVDEGKRPPLSWLHTKEGAATVYAVLAKFVRDATIAEVERPSDGHEYVKAIVDEWKRVTPAVAPSWVSPSGWPVVAEYRKSGARSLQLTAEIEGRTIKPRYFTGKGEMNWTAVRAAMAPNFIHSMDGAHVALSLSRAAELGITQLAVVHDAFGTTPSRTEQFAQVLREAFVEVHRGHPLKELEARLVAAGGTRLPELPQEGRLEIEGIAQARYLFS
jgi:DNA-directed RNA polymerase